jgi:hypothetical protein
MWTQCMQFVTITNKFEVTRNMWRFSYHQIHFLPCPHLLVKLYAWWSVHLWVDCGDQWLYYFKKYYTCYIYMNHFSCQLFLCVVTYCLEMYVLHFARIFIAYKSFYILIQFQYFLLVLVPHATSNGSFTIHVFHNIKSSMHAICTKLKLISAADSNFTMFHFSLELCMQLFAIIYPSMRSQFIISLTSHHIIIDTKSCPEIK